VRPSCRPLPHRQLGLLFFVSFWYSWPSLASRTSPCERAAATEVPASKVRQGRTSPSAASDHLAELRSTVAAMGEADKYLNPEQGDYNYPPPQQPYPPHYGQQPFQQPAPGYGPSNGYQNGYQNQPTGVPQPPAAYPHGPQGPVANQYRPSDDPGVPQMNSPVPNNQEFGGPPPTFEETFKISKPKYNDLWAGILLILVFCGFIAVSVITLNGFDNTYGTSGGGIYNNSNTFSLDSNTMILFAFVLAVAFVFSFAYIWLARAFPKQFIWVTGILNLCWALGTAIFYLYRRYWSAGIVFLIFAVFLAFCFYTWISRIPFSALMLKTSIDVSKKYGHVYLVSFIGGIVATLFGAWYSITLVAIYVKFEPSDNNPACSENGTSCSQGKVIGLIVFITFAMYWISEWLKNTIHTIIAGVYGSWYFYVHNFPRGATRGAMKRALTYSFGSISFGSLLVAIVQALRQICSIARSQAGQEGGIGGAIGYAVFCILGCFLSILEWAVEFLNRYAFCHIALYGKAYIPAAKDTWKMIKDRGIDALVNECLIGPVLSFGALFIGYACALLAYLYLLFTDPPYNNDGQYTAVVMAFAFLIAFQIAHVFTTPISSGIETIFVAAGWDPQVMHRDHPELYQEMIRVYPKVQQAIRV
jgi:hypothetical protein